MGFGKFSRLSRFLVVVFFTCLTFFVPVGNSYAIGSLPPCPVSPNCVVSQNADADHTIDPIVYHVDRNTAKQTLLKVLSVVPRTEVIQQTDDYIHAISKSRIFQFVDDVEFYLPMDEAVIHIRSASRLGEYDLGVNRRRLEQIRLALQDLKI